MEWSTSICDEPPTVNMVWHLETVCTIINNSTQAAWTVITAHNRQTGNRASKNHGLVTVSGFLTHNETNWYHLSLQLNCHMLHLHIYANQRCVISKFWNLTAHCHLNHLKLIRARRTKTEEQEAKAYTDGDLVCLSVIRKKKRRSDCYHGWLAAFSVVCPWSVICRFVLCSGELRLERLITIPWHGVSA